jgi:hypothetical protein
VPLKARIYRLERTLRLERRLHIIKLPARLAADDGAIEAAPLAAKSIVRREGDLTVIIKDFSEGEPPD